MYCKFCNREIDDSSKVCVYCGGKVSDSPESNTSDNKKGKILEYVLIALCIVSVILPFCTWVNIPAYDSIYSLFGGSGSISGYSLFTYVTAANTYSNEIFTLISYFCLALVIVAMILDIVFILIRIVNKNLKLGLSMTGSVIMLITSLLFAAFMSVVSGVFGNVINTTAVPWISVLTAIAGIVLTVMNKKKVKLQQ